MSVKTNTLEEIDLASHNLNFKRTDFFSFNKLSIKPDLVCFSHLRWDFVYQRPQHLFSRFSQELRVYFIEEPHFDVHDGNDFISVSRKGDNIDVVVPHLRPGRNFEEVETALSHLIEKFIAENNIHDYIAWYYTPMALGFTKSLKPSLTVYDCMDELSAFVGAPPELCERESKLLRLADLVFTGGHSLYEAKKNLHSSVYAFPSSIEVAHFKQARQPIGEPEDQVNIPYPRIGFFGVIDERMDVSLVDEVARLRPDWHFVFLGPVVKISQEVLPRRNNIHYLGMKSYDQLPSYISSWSIAMLPFALNESTKFISPTKTPEYLASGKPVVSSAIRDVVESYGKKGLVNIYNNSSDFILAAEKALQQSADNKWLHAVDEELKSNSWDLTYQKMTHLIVEKIIVK